MTCVNMRMQKVLLERVHSDNSYSLFLMMGKRFQIPLKDGHHWPTAEGHLNDVSLAGR